MKDADLAELAAEYKKAQKREQLAKDARKKIGERLDAEMARRGTKGIETGGWKITRVTPEAVVYDEAKLRRRLRKLWALVSKESLDTDKLTAAVQEGRINPQVVEACSTLVPKASYVLVNPA